MLDNTYVGNTHLQCGKLKSVTNDKPQIITPLVCRSLMFESASFIVEGAEYGHLTHLCNFVKHRQTLLSS